MNSRFTFGKKERLSHQKDIDALFEGGSSFNLNLFKVFFIIHRPAEAVPVQVLIAVPKKRFKRAVDRNRIRRRIREAYRLHKQLLIGKIGPLACSLQVGFVYTGDRSNIPYRDIENQLVGCLERLAKITGKSSSNNDDGVRTPPY